MTGAAVGFELRVAGVAASSIRIVELSLTEGVNRLYEADVRVLCDADLALEEHAPDQPAMLKMTLSGSRDEPDERKRNLHGIIRRAQLHGVRTHHKSERPMVEYTLTLVPRLWLLSRRRGSRIFQNCRVDEVIRTVLAEHQIPSQWRLERTYPSREYCTQFEESDLAFVTRLAAEAGLLSFFEQPAEELEPLGDVARQLAGLAAGAASSALSPATSAVSGAASQLDGVAGGWVGAGVGAATGIADAALGRLAGTLGLPREILVFADNARAYRPMSRGRPQRFEQLVAQVGLDLGHAAIGQLGSAVGGALGGGVGELASAGLHAGLDALASDGDSLVVRVRDPSGALQRPDELSMSPPVRSLEVSSRRFTFREFDPRRPNAELAARAHVPRSIDGVPDELSAAVDGLVPGAIGAGGVGTVAAGASQLAADPLGQGGQMLGQGAQMLGAAAGGAGALATATTQPYEIYEHHSQQLFVHWDYERDEPKRMLASALRNQDQLRAESSCPWFEAGRRFRLADHQLERLNIEYVAVAVTHEVTLQADEKLSRYRNQVVCVPSSRVYVPARPPRRNVQSCLTAIVQASDETDIHTDAGGQVKLCFHWDRGQPGAGYNTCWVRVMQPWAGAGYGALFLPRAGSEVVVVFEGGDPDRPLVLGGVYNGACPPPFVLPAEKTRSGFKTQTTPGADGSNELWFDDASGREKIFVRAQRDYQLNVLRDRRVEVGHDETHRVDGTRRIHVQGDSELRIVGRHEARFEADRVIRIDGRQQSNVVGDERREIGGGDHLRVAADQHHEVLGGRTQVTKGDVVMRTGGNLTQVVGGDGALRSLTSHVQGRMVSSASKTMRLSADEGIELVCGGTTLRLTSDKIELTSKELILQGDGARLRLCSKEARLAADVKVQALAEQVLLKSSGAALGLTTEATVEGSQVLLNSPSQASDQVQSSPEEPTIIELTDPDGQPMPNQPYRIVLSDGSEISGALNDEGRAELVLDSDAQIMFPGISDVEPQ